jgi:hypothetical protein
VVGSDQMAQKPWSLFKGQFTNYKGKWQEKSGWFYRARVIDRLNWQGLAI